MTSPSGSRMVTGNQAAPTVITYPAAAQIHLVAHRRAVDQHVDAPKHQDLRSRPGAIGIHDHRRPVDGGETAPARSAPRPTAGHRPPPAPTPATRRRRPGRQDSACGVHARRSSAGAGGADHHRRPSRASRPAPPRAQPRRGVAEVLGGVDRAGGGDRRRQARWPGVAARCQRRRPAPAHHATATSSTTAIQRAAATTWVTPRTRFVRSNAAATAAGHQHQHGHAVGTTARGAQGGEHRCNRWRPRPPVGETGGRGACGSTKAGHVAQYGALIGDRARPGQQGPTSATAAMADRGRWLGGRGPWTRRCSRRRAPARPGAPLQPPCAARRLVEPIATEAAGAANGRGQAPAAPSARRPTATTTPAWRSRRRRRTEAATLLGQATPGRPAPPRGCRFGGRR